MIAAIITAAGQGLRMGARRPKQFLPLRGKTILEHTLNRFVDIEQIDQIVITLPRDDLPAATAGFGSITRGNNKVIFAAGGRSRQESVCNGLHAIAGEEGIVLIHDGVRPLINASIIRACIDGARRWGACIPALAVTDTLKQVDAQSMITGTVDRPGLWLAQTPQAFSLSLIRDAHQQAAAGQWQTTDDAALVERLGIAVKVIPGLRENIKITTPEDLVLVEAWLSLHGA